MAWHDGSYGNLWKTNLNTNISTKNHSQKKKTSQTPKRRTLLRWWFYSSVLGIALLYCVEDEESYVNIIYMIYVYINYICIYKLYIYICIYIYICSCSKERTIHPHHSTSCFIFFFGGVGGLSKKMDANNYRVPAVSRAGLFQVVPGLCAQTNSEFHLVCSDLFFMRFIFHWCAPFSPSLWHPLAFFCFHLHATGHPVDTGNVESWFHLIPWMGRCAQERQTSSAWMRVVQRVRGACAVVGWPGWWACACSVRSIFADTVPAVFCQIWGDL